MKVEKETWEQKAQNLLNRRSQGTISPSDKKIGDYAAHLRKIQVGKSVLDVGAGNGHLFKCLPDHTVFYTGIDPFPAEKGIQKMTIEECEFADNYAETVVMFAALDNVRDFNQAIAQIKRLASKNILFLTGVNIEPDKYHTIKITESMLINEMKPFKVGHMEYLHPKIILIEFKK